MAHPVIPPNLPANPDLGDVFEHGDGDVWTYTNIGWVKTVIILGTDFPIYNGLLVDDIYHGGA